MRRQLRLLHGQLHHRDLQHVVWLVCHGARQLDRVGNWYRPWGPELHFKCHHLVRYINDKWWVCDRDSDGRRELVKYCGGREAEAVLDGSFLRHVRLSRRFRPVKHTAPVRHVNP